MLMLFALSLFYPLDKADLAVGHWHKESLLKINGCWLFQVREENTAAAAKSLSRVRLCATP